MDQTVSPYFKFGDDLHDERNILLEAAHVAGLEQRLRGRGDVRQQLLLQTHHHAVQELPYAVLESALLRRHLHTRANL